MTIGPTVELMLGAMLIAVPSGLALGTLAAVNRGRLTDRIIMACSVAGVSMPVFFIGLILIQYVGFKWALLPFTGRTGPVWDGGLPSLILPALTLGAVLIGPIARLTRTAVLEVLGADFVRTARAKGLRETGGDRPSRAAQRHDPRRHPDRAAGGVPARRRGRHRNHVLVARRRPARRRRHRLQRFSDGAGRDHDPRHRLPVDQPRWSTCSTSISIRGCSEDERRGSRDRLCRGARHRRIRPRRRVAPAGARPGGRTGRAGAHRDRARGAVGALDRALRSLLHGSHQGDAAARRRALVRHRQYRPRHPQPRHLRHAQHADAGAGRRDRRRLHRRRSRHPRRLLSPSRRLDHAAGRRDAGLPRDPDRARGGRDLRRRADGRGDRARRRHRARCRAGGARRRDRRDGPGIHGGRPRRRRLATAS